MSKKDVFSRPNNPNPTKKSYSSLCEAFGRPPATLLAELRLNAAHRALLQPGKDTSVTKVAARYGFVHFGRFAATYQRQFGELPSVTFAKARGS